MNILEVTKEYLARKEDWEAKSYGNTDPEEWLGQTTRNENWPDSLMSLIKACWIDKDALAIIEARRYLDLYQINTGFFKLNVISRGDITFLVEAVHANNNQSWIAYEVIVVIGTDNRVCSAMTRLRIRPID